MNFFDRIIESVAPKYALDRERSRKALEALRSYDAASYSRRTSGWNASATSQNNETFRAIRTLRDRSRELVRNNAWAKKAVEVLGNNIIGTGIRATPLSDSATKNKRIMREWKAWAETTDCDVTGRNNFYGLQRLVMNTVAESGEALIVRRRRNVKGKIPFQLHVLEGDYIQHSYNYFPKPTEGEYTLMGIVFDEYDKRKAYWMFKRHPGDIFNYSIPELVDAEDIIHVFKVERPGQVRGIPAGVSAMLLLKDLDDYMQAEIVRQKIAACFSVFITDPLGEAGNKQNPLDEQVEPGIIYNLDPGKEVKFASPPTTTGYDTYTRTVLRAVACGYGVTYEALTGDLSNVNFSSGRMGWLEFHRNVTSWQNDIIIPIMCDGVWNWFMEALQLMGIVNEPVPAKWTPPRREMIDPSKEFKALNEAVRSGFLSWSEVVNQLGYDPMVTMAQLTEDSKLFEANNLMPTTDPKYDPARKPDQPADGSQKVTE